MATGGVDQDTENCVYSGCEEDGRDDYEEILYNEVRYFVGVLFGR